MMSEQTPEQHPDQRWSTALSSAGSLLIHLALLIFCMAFWWAEPSAPGNDIQGGFVDTQAPGEEVAEFAFEAADLTLDVPVEQPPDAIRLTEIQDIPLWSPATVNTAASETGGASDVAGALDSAGDGQAPGEAAQFFGITENHSSVVFVVDSSGSMSQGFPGPARTRMARVQRELAETIQQMKPNQRFSVIFFSDGPITPPQRGLLAASQRHKQKTLEWVNSIPADGSTHPEQALLLALRMQPRAIYFLTDGAFEYRVVPLVIAANRRRIPIHTIGIGDPGGEELLKEIASKTGGRYRFVSGEAD